MWKECNICNSYLVSTEGEVKNKKTNKILKPKIDKNGYSCVGLSMGKKGKRKMIFIHTLVATAFVPNPYNKPYVKHLNNKKTDNNYTNLIWLTRQEVLSYSKQNGAKKFEQGSGSCNAKLNDIQILYCRMIYKPRDKQYGANALAKQFGVSKSTMHYILHNITYKFPSRQTGKVTGL